MRCLGLDIGDKTVGISRSDELGWTAQPVEVLHFQQASATFSKLAKLICESKIDTVVYGFPLNMNGTKGPQAEKVEDFVAHLEIYLTKRNLHPSLIAWDERLSTVGAERALLEADISRAKRKKVIDKMAACFILQGYLDSLQ